MQLGDDVAKGLGVNVELVRLVFTAIGALLAASAVSVAGLLGFVGLIVPHTVRLLTGSDYRFLIPSSALLGIAVVTYSDTLARVAFAPLELPVGIFMAALGAPVSVQNLSIAIGKNTILQNININFREGKRTAIIGPNGCGKSTLLRAVAGLNRNYIGKVLLNGADMKNMPRRKIAEMLAILPQGVTAPADLTVRELVACGRFPYRSLFKREGKNDAEIIETAMQKTHIAHLAGRFVATLSGGERQRAWIAMALAQQPQILLLDEPTTYLDIAHQLEIMQIITELNAQENMTVIMVIHDINHARLYADDVVIIKNKGVFAGGCPAEIITPPNLAEVFGVEAAVYKNGAQDEVIFPFALRNK